MSWYINEYKPTSIIDYGCGIGAYLEAGLICGITNVKGFDIGGEIVKRYTDESVQKYIEYLDCTKSIVTEKFDCVLSLETGEHIETKMSDQFVLNICNSSKKNGTIIFSAAQPGQPGTGHINCQEKKFWIDKFLENSFQVDMEKTEFIKNNWSILKAPNYIINNLIIFKYIV
jgi:2-polyprenyl-3-methyl-5-hydroxy-6-metoxy-1,4-benzoquinol methylase